MLQLAFGAQPLELHLYYLSVPKLAMELDSWLRLPVAQVDEADLASELSSTQLQRWANETEDTHEAPRRAASWLRQTNKADRLGHASQGGPSKEDEPIGCRETSDDGPEGDEAHSRAQPPESGSSLGQAPASPHLQAVPPSPLSPTDFLRVLQRPVGAPAESQPPVPSLLDSLLPLLPMANLGRLRTCLSALAVGYRQQELTSVHLQAQLRDARFECLRLARDAEAAQRQVSEERERAGFLEHALVDAKAQTEPGTVPLSVSASGGDTGSPDWPSIPLAVLRGQALQRAAERIAALSDAVISARAEATSLRDALADSNAVTRAGEASLQAQVARLSAELAQQSITAEAKVRLLCATLPSYLTLA